MPVSSSSLRDMAWNWDEGGCRTQRWRTVPESIRGEGGGERKKMTVDTETWCFAPPLCLSTSQFLLFFKEVLKSFWEQWEFAKCGPLAACLHRPAACWGTTQFLSFCSVAQLEYRKTSSCVSTHVWHVLLDCRIYAHWSTRDQGCTDDFPPAKACLATWNLYCRIRFPRVQRSSRWSAARCQGPLGICTAA